MSIDDKVFYVIQYLKTCSERGWSGVNLYWTEDVIAKAEQLLHECGLPIKFEREL